jgi:predicted amino acid racemase
MTGPRLEIDLDKIYHNARTLVQRLAERGISVTGVTKATLGSPEIARALLRAGVSGLGDSRIENIETMRRAGIPASMTLIRSPMVSQADRVVIVRETLRFPNIAFKGIGTNLACRSGVSPDAKNMTELSALASLIEATFGVTIDIVSGGNSANLEWALGIANSGRINDLRLGEALLLGRETLHRQPIDGLHTDAITLIAEVIESKVKPSQPWGEIAQNAFGEQRPTTDRGQISQSILAIGRQDTDCSGLHASPGIEVLGSSSDHLIVDSGGERLPIGSEVPFQLNYSALVRAMTSPFVAKVVTVPPDDRLDRPDPDERRVAIAG